MSSVKPIDIPSATNIHLSSAFAPQYEAEKDNMSRVPYTNAVGSLLHAMVCTRSNLTHVVSRFVGKNGKENWQAIKDLLLPKRYF